MYHILPESHDNVLGIRVEGRMSVENYATLLPFVANLATRYGSIRIFLDFRDFTGADCRGILKTLLFAFKHRSAVDKKAVVTDQRWIYTWTRLLVPFFRTEVRCFPSAQIEKAWDWVNK